MRFGALPLDEALGAIAAHTIRLGRQGAGGVIKKGKRLDAGALARLREAGHATVVCAHLDEGDVIEDEAAARVARAVAGRGVRLAEATTGRCNLHALADGLVMVDKEPIDRLNLVDESVTVATLSPYAAVRAGDVVATVKVIPYAVPGGVLEACAAAVGGGEGAGPLRVAPFTAYAAGLVLTRLPNVPDSILDRAARAQAVRAERTGGRIAREVRCAHDEAQVAAAIGALLDEKLSPILVLGASAIADRRDVIPAAIERAGGLVEHFGMPVDPGNLLLLARRGRTPILGVPGCARSLKRSGYDAVVERLAAGLPVARADLMTLGVGGLLVEALARSDGDEADLALDQPARRVGAVVLAAGGSTRMGSGANKLVALLDGKPVVAHVVDALLESAARPIVVVTGNEADKVGEALAGRGVQLVHNARWSEGMSGSLAVGVAALGDLGLDGALLCLGDMPRVRAAHVAALLGAFNPAAGAAGEADASGVPAVDAAECARPIVVPTFERHRGNPVLFAARYFDELRALSGDVGARAVIERHAASVRLLPMSDDGVLLDVDTPAALASLAHGASPG